MGGQLFISDGVAMYRTTQAIVRDHTFAILGGSELPQFITGWDGQRYSQYDPGQPLVAIPFYLAGWMLSKIFPRGDEVALTVFAVSLLPQFATALAAVTLCRIALVLFGEPRIATGLALLWGTGTLAWPYSKFYFSEALLTFLLLLSCWLMLEATKRNSRRYLIFAGAAFGGAMSVRVASVVYLSAFIIYLMIEIFDEKTESIEIARRLFIKIAQFSIGIFPFLGLLLCHNYIRFHNILQSGYEGQGFTTPLSIGLAGLLFSPGRSLFLFSPLVLLGIISLWHLKKHSPSMTAFIITASVIALVFYSMWWSWHGGWSWGPRFLVPLVPFLIIPIGSRLRSRKFLFAVVVVWIFSLLAIIPGISTDFNVYFTDLLYRENVREYLLWFDPMHSQLIIQWQYLLRGQALTFAGNHLSDFGLPRFANLLYPLVMGLAFLWTSFRVAVFLFMRPGSP